MGKDGKGGGLRLAGAAVTEEELSPEDMAQEMFIQVADSFKIIAHNIQGRYHADYNEIDLCVNNAYVEQLRALLDERCGVKMSYADFFSDRSDKQGFIALRLFKSYTGWEMVAMDANVIFQDPKFPASGDVYLFETKDFEGKSPYANRNSWQIREEAAKKHGEDSQEVRIVDQTIEALRKLFFQTIYDLDSEERKTLASEVRTLSITYRDLVFNVLKDFIHTFNEQLQAGFYNHAIRKSGLDPEAYVQKVFKIGNVDLLKMTGMQFA
jgi:hypothetical protein